MIFYEYLVFLFIVIKEIAPFPSPSCTNYIHMIYISSHYEHLLYEE